MNFQPRFHFVATLLAALSPPVIAQDTPEFYATVAKVAYYQQQLDAAPTSTGHSFFLDVQHRDGSSAQPDLDYLIWTRSNEETLEFPWGSLTIPFSQDFESAALLEAAFPDEEYSLRGRLFLGDLEVVEWSASAYFPPGSYLPPPTITNLAGLQSLATNEPVIIHWTRLPSYNSSQHSIRITLVDDLSGELVTSDTLSTSDDQAGFYPPFLSIPLNALPGRRLRATVFFRDTVFATDVEEARLRFQARRVSATSFHIQFASSKTDIVLPSPTVTLPSPGQPGPGIVEFQLTLPPGTVAELQESSSLSGWTTVSSATTPASGQVNLSAPLPTEANVRFYRIQTR